MAHKTNISREMLDRYVSGQATLDEIALVSRAMAEDNNLRDLVGTLENLDKNGVLHENKDIPMASMAAMSENNLCDVMCEEYILRDYVDGADTSDYVSEALDNCWLKESGTPLHNMGRLLEKNGLSVTHRYDCKMEDIAEAFLQKQKVIAVVDYGQLWNKEEDGIFHAVVCLTLVDGVIRIYDPAIDGHSYYTDKEFERAWQCSRHYMVCASAGSLKYVPHPIDVSDVTLDEDLLELTEAIAENAHEIWAAKRQSEGWQYGPERNDVLLQHPDMVPYSELSEGEKYYDRDMALNTIRLVRKLGFNITRRYTQYCPHCGEFVADDMSYCPHCGGKIE